MIARCPNSIIGNGTAVFALAQNNNQNSPLAKLAGETLVFNGGRSGGLPKIKVYSYSYDTGVGIYTEAILQPDGHLLFNIPVLTADSSVRRLDMDIPGQQVVMEKPSLDQTVTLPAGQDPNYAQAKCVGNASPWTADFTLGSRDISGNPIGPPEVIVSDSGSFPCTGLVGKAKIGSVQVSGPATVKRNKFVTYRIKVKNTGVIAAADARLRVSGKGIALDAPVGSINPGATRTVNVRVRPRIAGRIKATFQVNSNNAGSRKATRTVTVAK